MKFHYSLLLGLVLSCTQLQADDFFDPTQPPEFIEKYAVNDDLSAADVSMILYSKEGSFCIINGVSYKEGDFFGRFFIEKILKNKIILKRNSEAFVLVFIERYA